MYDTAQAGQALNVARETRPLESIAHAVQRVNTATVQMQSFLDRFHGPGPTLDAVEAKPAEPPQHHAANLDRLFSALDRLEQKIAALNLIG